jgi:hypothetical protein
MGIAVIVGYLLIMQTSGFYLASWIAFSAIVLFYTTDINRQKTTRIVLVSLGFMTAIYVLFSLSLRVITPGFF